MDNSAEAIDIDVTRMHNPFIVMLPKHLQEEVHKRLTHFFTVEAPDMVEHLESTVAELVEDAMDERLYALDDTIPIDDIDEARRAYPHTITLHAY